MLLHYTSASERGIHALRKFSKAVEHSANMIFITDARGVIEYVNPRFIAATGFSEEVIGRDPRVLRSDELPRSVYDDILDTVRAEGAWHGEVQNRRKDGSLH